MKGGAAGRGRNARKEAPPPRVVIVGNLTLDDVVLPDGTTHMASIGGNSLYAALAARMWQSSVGVVTRKGEDFPADLFSQLKNLGIATEGIVSIPGPTVRSWIVYEADGSRHWLYRTPRTRSREVAVKPGDFPAAWLAPDQQLVVHVAAMPLDAAEGVVEVVRARAPQALITLDTHEDYSGGEYRSRLTALAARVDAFLPSREELAELLGYDDPPRGLRSLSVLPTPVVIVKMGADGILLWDRRREKMFEIDSAADAVVDVTGAGDAFCGGLAAGLALGDDPPAAAARGLVSAACAVGSIGSLGLAAVSNETALLRLGAARPPRLVSPPDPASEVVPGADRGISSATAVMRDEIALIPTILGEQITALEPELGELRARLKTASGLYLTGCGDSAMAGLASALAFRRHGWANVEAIEALELSRYRVRYLPPASTVICLSFSGQVGRTIEAAVQARRFGHRVIVVTGSNDSPLSRQAHDLLKLDVPTLGYSPGTATYVAMLLALLQLAAGSEAVEPVPERARVTLEIADPPALNVARLLAQRPLITFLGAGPNLATAAFGAAKLFEGPQMAATSANLEEWAHGEYFVSGRHTPVIVVAPSGASVDRAREILSELAFVDADSVLVSDAELAERRLATIPVAAGLPEEMSPVLAALALSQLAYHLTQARNQAAFEFASPEVAREHYETIHRATVGEPA